jgi:hypothetical protein
MAAVQADWSERSYGEESRLYGPPQGTFDAEWVTRILAGRRPGLGWEQSARLVRSTWRHLWASPQLSPADLAAYVALDEPAMPDADVTAAVEAALDFCELYEVEPPR